MLKFIKRRIVNALSYSLDGIKDCWKAEEAFRLEICVAPFLIIIALFLNFYVLEKVLLITSVILVLIIELLNTGFEKTINFISKDKNATAKFVKDIGSAAVLFSIINLFFTWGLILYSNM